MTELSIEVTAALNRIAAVADQDDVNLIRSELARLRRVLDAGDDDDVDYSAWPIRERERGMVP